MIKFKKCTIYFSKFKIDHIVSCKVYLIFCFFSESGIRIWNTFFENQIQEPIVLCALNAEKNISDLHVSIHSIPSSMFLIISFNALNTFRPKPVSFGQSLHPEWGYVVEGEKKNVIITVSVQPADKPPITTLGVYAWKPLLPRLHGYISICFE